MLAHEQGTQAPRADLQHAAPSPVPAPQPVPSVGAAQLSTPADPLAATLARAVQERSSGVVATPILQRATAAQLAEAARMSVWIRTAVGMLAASAEAQDWAGVEAGNQNLQTILHMVRAVLAPPAADAAEPMAAPAAIGAV